MNIRQKTTQVKYYFLLCDIRHIPAQL